MHGMGRQRQRLHPPHLAIADAPDSNEQLPESWFWRLGVACCADGNVQVDDDEQCGIDGS